MSEVEIKALWLSLSVIMAQNTLIGAMIIGDVNMANKAQSDVNTLIEKIEKLDLKFTI